MKITLQCPDCHQQVPEGNAFCIFCGCKLTPPEPEAPAAETPASADAAWSAPAPYAGPCYCPNGHDVVDPSLGFCPVCGAPLVDEPPEPDILEEELLPVEKPRVKPVAETPEADPESPTPRPVAPRTCPNGHTYADPSLVYCPECGMPFGAFEPEKPRWRCACGHENDMDLAFCTECGMPRDGKAPGRRSAFGRHAEKPKGPTHPAGMRAPTDDDLTVKHKFGRDRDRS